MALIDTQAQHKHTFPHKELSVQKRWREWLEGLKMYVLSNESQCLMDGETA